MVLAIITNKSLRLAFFPHFSDFICEWFEDGMCIVTHDFVDACYNQPMLEVPLDKWCEKDLLNNEKTAD